MPMGWRAALRQFCLKRIVERIRGNQAVSIVAGSSTATLNRAGGLVMLQMKAWCHRSGR